MSKTNIFKKYDLRGEYPAEINAGIAKRLALAYYELLKPTLVIIGYDTVDGSYEVGDMFAKVLSGQGVRVVSIGVVSTPMLYYACASINVSLGIMCSASHLGEGYTGVKPFKDGNLFSSDEIQKFRNLFDQIPENAEYALGEYETQNINEKYISAVLKLFNTKIDKYTVAVDAGNGPNSKLFETAYKSLGIRYFGINTEIKATGLSHPSNPKLKENRSDLENAIKKYNADVGVIWDGDCDRCYFLDKNSNVIPPEFAGIQIAGFLKKVFGYAKITVDVRASAAVETECAKNGVAVKRIQAWHVPIKDEMKKDSAIGFGFEVSGHFVYKDFYMIDDGLITSLMFLSAISALEEDYMEVLKHFRETYYILEEMNFETAKSIEEVIEELKVIYKDGEITQIDGISVDYPDWRFNVRSSASEPIIRLNISGTNKALVEENLQKIKPVIEGNR